MNHNQKTPLVTKEEARKNLKWYILDATGKTLGRFSSEVAKILRGKHKPDFTPHIDTGDGVIVINSDKIIVTGAKSAQKMYSTYSGYIGGLKQIVYKDLMVKHPNRIIEHAVKGMLPKTKLGKKQLKKLYIFSDDKHNLQAQKPTLVNI